MRGRAIGALGGVLLVTAVAATLGMGRPRTVVEPVAPQPVEPEPVRAAPVKIDPGCPHPAGVRARATLGQPEDFWRKTPLRHVVIVTQENRSFDHQFGALARRRPEVDGFPPDYAVPDLQGRPVKPFPARTTCVDHDPPHQWAEMEAQWNGGRMDGFIRNAAKPRVDGRYVMVHHDERQLPFYYWLADTFAISDRHFSSALAGTWPNRQFLYTGRSRRHGRTGELRDVPTIFDALDRARVPWAVYSDEGTRQDCIGWTLQHRGMNPFSSFLKSLRAGTLPPVSFVDPTEADEHPTGDVQRGEAWLRDIYLTARASPLWPGLAIIFTYDESGGFFDHEPPPSACPPTPDEPTLNRLGIRIPLIVISPWAKARHVSHRVTEHASILKLVEALHDLPTLSARDANAEALLDLFDFSRPALLDPPPPPEAGRGGCSRSRLTARR